MTRDELDAIAARANAATPGPWSEESDESVWELYAGRGEFHGMKLAKCMKRAQRYAEYWPNDADAAFIAHARGDVPALLVHIDTQQAQIDALTRDAALARFGASVLVEYASENERGDLEGGWVQEAAIRHGVMDQIRRVIPCNQACACAEFYGEGETAWCYPVKDWHRVMDVAKGVDAARTVTPGEA